MRTTLDIDDDLLAAAKELAGIEHRTAGEVVSRLLRQALLGPLAASGQPAVAMGDLPRTGFAAFAPRGSVVTNAQVDALRDQEGV